MNERDRSKHETRMRTLEQLRAHVDADSRVHIRFEVRCGRVLRGWRLIPKCIYS